MKRNLKIWRAKLLCTAYCTRKRTNIPGGSVLSIARVSRRRVPTLTQPTLERRTKQTNKKTMLHLAWVSLPPSWRPLWTEKKATWRRGRPPPPPPPPPRQRGRGGEVWNQLHCSDGVLKEIVFTPLNYIQTFKIQIYLFSSGMSDMHFYSIYIYWEKPLNWEWHSRLGKIQNVNMQQRWKTAIIEKQRNTK